MSGTIYVDVNASGLTHDGATWTSAYTDLQQALAAAAPNTQIRVADGVYKPTTGTDREATFAMKSGVSILGGFAGDGAADPDARQPLFYVTTLSGEIGAAGISDNSYHVVTAPAGVQRTAVLDGVTVTAGNADFQSIEPRAFGGALYIADANPTLSNCIFTNNRAYFRGGAVYNDNGSPLFDHCTFTANQSTSQQQGVMNYGGAVANNFGAATFVDCAFNNNSGNAGGAIYTVGPLTLTRTTFTGNSGSVGGAIEANNFLTLSATDCTFTDNSATDSGGAVHASFATLDLDGCSFVNNTATFAGGGFAASNCLGSVAACTFTGNSVTSSGFGRGGGMAALSGIGNFTPLVVSDCQFNNNTAAANGGGLFVDDSHVTVRGTSFTQNTATAGNGGGLSMAGSQNFIDRCTFTDNTAQGNGGGVSTSSNNAVTNSAFYANTAGFSGGGLANGPSGGTKRIYNCIFVGNAALGGFGGGIRTTINGVEIINCAFVANSASSAGGGASATNAGNIVNSIFRGNTAPGSPQIESGPGNSVLHSDVQGGFAGTNNIDVDPLFRRNPSRGADNAWGTADDDYGSLHLPNNSPVIDVGRNASVPAGEQTDLDYHTRILDVPAVAGSGPGAIVDMGPYEVGFTATFVAGEADDYIYLRASGANLLVFDNPAGTGTPVASYAIDQMTSFTVSGGGGHDTLAIDAATSAAPYDIRFIGGAGNDTVRLIGNTVRTATYDVRVGPNRVLFGPAQITMTGSERTLIDNNSTTPGGPIVVQSLTLDRGGKLALPDGMRRTLKTGGAPSAPLGLLMSSLATLVLADGNLAYQYIPVGGGGSPIGASSGSGYNGVTGLLAAGREGPYGIASTAAGDHSFTTLGIGESSSVLGLNPVTFETGMWNGVTVNGQTLLIKYTYQGDANLDGFVSGDDYAAIDFNIAAPNSSGWYNGDFNLDGIISGDDYAAIDFMIAAQGAPL